MYNTIFDKFIKENCEVQNMRPFYKIIPIAIVLMMASCQGENPVDKNRVSSVSLNKTTLSLVEGDTSKLTATINPSTAKDKTVTWSSDNTDFVTVSNGTVTALRAGNATVTVTTRDGNKTASCEVAVSQLTDFTVEFKSNSEDGRDSLTSLSGQISSGSKYISSSTAEYVYAGVDGIKFGSRRGGGDVSITLNKRYTVLSVVAKAKAYINSGTGSITSSNLTINEVTNTISSNTLVDYTYELDRSETNSITLSTSARCYLKSLQFVLGEIEPIDPSAIAIEETLQLGAGRSKELTVEYTPANANQNKQITWSKESGDSDISVDASGKVAIASGASIGDTAIIKAQLTRLPNVNPAYCTVTVIDQPKDEWTVMFYVSGSNLESDGGAATTDIAELLSVPNQPSDINILYQTGGTTKWYNSNVDSDVSISASKLQRWEARNGKLYVKDNNMSQGNMAASATLESYLKWGITNYPAEKYAVIFWNHGGAMQGCCIDDNYSSYYSYDYLTVSEANTAFTNVFRDLSITEKFELVGYDCCSMQVQDIAEKNSHFFNYMVASEELENGDGWDYTCWIDDLYARKSTPQILEALCTGFVAQYNGSYYGNDQTLSALDLSYMETYKTAWENMSLTLKNNIGTYESSGNKFYQYLIDNVKHFGDASGSYGYEDLGIFDVKDFLNKVKNNSTLYNGLSSIINQIDAAFNNLVICNEKGSSAGNANGLCFYFDTGAYCYPSSVYSTSQTNFTNWRSIVTKYGYSA